ncbi:MAG: hypothetical protein AMXMBFR44_5010 [Candidatus Campbellbacteria bacterium]
MRYDVTVKLRNDFVQEENGKLVVGIRTVPEKGKANEEVVRKIAKYLKVPQSSIRIIAGATSRKKVIEVQR